MFSLDGLGYLSYDSLIQRDYPVVLANLYIFALIGLVVTDMTEARRTEALLRDLTHRVVQVQEAVHQLQVPGDN